MTTYIVEKGTGRLIEKKERKRPRVHNVMGDLPAYMSPLGERFHVVEGRYARREEMKRFDVREVDPSERPKDAGIPKTKAQAAAEKAELAARPTYEMTPDLKRRLMRGY